MKRSAIYTMWVVLFLFIIPGIAHTQQRDTAVDWSKIELSGRRYKILPAIKRVTWPYYLGSAVLGGTLIYLATKKEQPDQPTVLLANQDALSIGCNSNGTIQVLANDIGENIQFEGVSPVSGLIISHLGNGVLLVNSASSGQYSFTYTIRDLKGQTATGTVSVFVVDILAPLIQCPASVTLSCEVVPNISITGVPILQDNCDPQPQSNYMDQLEGSGCEQIISRTWTSTDNAQNLSSCIQNITRLDLTPPTWANCPEDITVSCGQEMNPLITGQALATDFCNGPGTVQFTDDLSAFNNCSGHILRTWIAADACGNSASPCVQTIRVIPSDCNFSASFNVMDANCGISNGQVEVVIQPPGNYSVLWGNGQSGSLLTNLAPGNYSITILDPVGSCAEVFPVAVGVIPPVLVSMVDIGPAGCLTPGVLVLTLDGAASFDISVVGPVNIELSNLPPGPLNLGDFLFLQPGVYNIDITGETSCNQILPLTIPYNPPFSLSPGLIFDPTCPLCSDGVVQLQVSLPASPPLQIWINGMPGGQSNTLDFSVQNLPAGTYTFEVVDQGGAGCRSNPVTVNLTPPYALIPRWSLKPAHSWSLMSVNPNLEGALIAAFRETLPEHPKLDPMAWNGGIVKPGPNTGLSLTLEGNWTGVWEAGLYEGVCWTDYSNNLTMTSFQGVRQQWRLVRHFPAKSERPTPYLEAGLVWDRISLSPGNSFGLLFENLVGGHTMEVNVLAGFIAPGLQWKVSDHCRLELNCRLGLPTLFGTDFQGAPSKVGLRVIVD